MMPGWIGGATRNLGVSQGHGALTIRDKVTGGVPSMVSAWYPTPDELERLAKGAPVYLEVLGSKHPPVKITVGAVSA